MFVGFFPPLHIYKCIYICMCVCMYVCACVCACMYVCMYICMCVCMYVCTCIYIYIYICTYIYMYMCACMRICACIYHYKVFSNLKIHNWSYFVCLPLDLPPKSKLYVILAMCYERKCLTVAAILNINTIMFNINMNTCCLAYIVFSIRFLVHENL